MTKPDLMAELAEVVRLADKATPGPWLYRAKSNSWYTAPPEGSRYSYGDFIMGMGDDAEGTNEWDEPFLIAAVQFLRTHHAELEAMARDQQRVVELLRKTAAVAVTQLFDQHRDDVVREFDVDELSAIVELTAPLIHGNVSVESVYREAWEAAMHSAQAAMPNGASGETGEGE